MTIDTVQQSDGVVHLSLLVEEVSFIITVQTSAAVLILMKECFQNFSIFSL